MIKLDQAKLRGAAEDLLNWYSAYRSIMGKVRANQFFPIQAGEYVKDLLRDGELSWPHYRASTLSQLMKEYNRLLEERISKLTEADLDVVVSRWRGIHLLDSILTKESLCTFVDNSFPRSNMYTAEQIDRSIERIGIVFNSGGFIWSGATIPKQLIQIP